MMHAKSRFRNFSIALALALAPPAFAKAVAKRYVPAARLAAYLEAEQKGRALNGLETQALELARIGKELGANIPHSFTETEAEALPNLGAAEVAGSLHAAIPTDWTKPPSPKLRKLLKKNRKLLESYLSASSPYAWAWVRSMLGEKEEAKESLERLFTAEYEKVMRLDKAVNAFGHTPLTEAELYYQALKPQAHGAEARELEDKLQKMKVHVSNLPQSAILT